MRSLVLETQRSPADSSGAMASLATAGEVGWPDGAGMSEEQRGGNPVSVFWVSTTFNFLHHFLVESDQGEEAWRHPG